MDDKRLSCLKKQIDECMKNAMKDMIESTVNENMNDQQIDWIVSLLSELVERINNLTPSRSDMHDSLKKMVDTDLIKQMLKHDAIDTKDVIFLVNEIYDRLLMLCAPSQDDSIKEYKDKCLKQPTTSKMISYLLYTSNDVINEINRLLYNCIPSEES